VVPNFESLSKSVDFFGANPLLFEMKPAVKLVVVGDTYVGKTSILDRALKDQFDDSPQPTTAVFTTWAFNTSDADLSRLNPIQFEIWDTAGQERFRSLSAAYFRGASAILMVFDLTRPETAKELESFRAKIADSCEAGKFALGLVGNKNDLDHNITPAIMSQFQEENKADFALMCSARTNENIPSIFEEFLNTTPIRELLTQTSGQKAPQPAAKSEKTCC
jgi:small GTP-binding protein